MTKMIFPDEYGDHPFRHPFYWIEDHTGWWLPIARKWWHLVKVIKYPRASWYDWRKWRKRPKVGDVIWGCDSQQHTVVKIGPTGDDLWCDDGASYSWMNCCNWEKE